MEKKNKDFFLPLEKLHAGYSITFLAGEFFDRYLDKKEVRAVILHRAKEFGADSHLNKLNESVLDYINENLKPQLDQYLNVIINLLQGNVDSEEDRTKASMYLKDGMKDKLVPWFRMIQT